MPRSSIDSLWNDSPTRGATAIKHDFYNLTHPCRDLDSCMASHTMLRGGRWVSERVIIGDCYLCVPEASLADWIAIGARNGITFNDSNVKGLREVGEDEEIRELVQVASDCGGNNFYQSSSTGEYYILWHDPETLERIDLKGAAFIDWLIVQYPEQPVGRPWVTFKTVGLENPYSYSFAHADCYPVTALAERALKLWDFPLVYSTPSTFSAFAPDPSVLVEAYQKHRGFLTYLDFTVSSQYLNDETHLIRAHAFIQWLEQEGFRNPDDPSVRGWEGDEDDDGL